MFEFGGFPKEVSNPWKYDGEPNAPFNQEFYLVFNVAVGGVAGYFPEGQCGKPWSDKSPTAVNDFYNNKGSWYPTWNYPETHDSAMQIDWVKVYSFDDEGNEKLL